MTTFDSTFDSRDTNPLDVMTQLTLEYSGFEAGKVIGSGTTLDTARLKYLISEKIGICPKDIQAFVIGEHGDSEFVAWSNASVALTSLDEFLSDRVRSNFYDNFRQHF